MAMQQVGHIPTVPISVFASWGHPHPFTTEDERTTDRPTEGMVYWRKRWAQALRSEAYTQTRGPWRIVYESGRVEHCAGGVLMDLMVQDGLLPAWERLPHEHQHQDGATAFYPGMKSATADASALVGMPLYWAVVNGNDWAGVSFAQLADVIEEGIGGLAQPTPEEADLILV